jgi:hypothetical protein
MRQPELARLVRILGLLGSDHAGERANAALAAHRLVKSSGRSWSDLLSPLKVRGAQRYGRFVDVFHDPVSAANSRMRQLRRENDELKREVKRLKQSLDARNAPARKAALGSPPAGRNPRRKNP